MLSWPKSGTILFQRSPRAQDAICLPRWIGSRYVAIIVHTYTSDHMHQVVAGLGEHTIYLALPCTGLNEECFSVPLEHSTKALTTISNSWKIIPRTPHIPNFCCRQPIIYCTTSKSDWHCLVNPIHYHQAHAHVTYYIATSTPPRTVHSIS